MFKNEYKIKNEALTFENYKLKDEDENLKRENQNLRGTVEDLSSKNMTLENTVEQQKNHINEIYVKYEALEKRNKELEENYAKLYEVVKKRATVKNEEKRLEKENIPDKCKKEMLRELCGSAIDIANVLDLFFGLY